MIEKPQEREDDLEHRKEEDSASDLIEMASVSRDTKGGWVGSYYDGGPFGFFSM